MSEGYQTAPQLEVLELLAGHGVLTTERIADLMIQARTAAGAPATRSRRRLSSLVERRSVMVRMAEQLLWRLAAQNLVAGRPGQRWSISDAGRALLAARTGTAAGTAEGAAAS